MKRNTFERVIWSAMLIMAPFIASFARHLTPNEALERLTKNSTIKRIAGKPHFTLAYTEEAEGKEMVYVFNNSNGFILTGADDNMEALLGYSDNGKFDYDSAPPALKWWIGQYASQAYTALYNEAVTLSQPQNANYKVSRPAIPYLVQTGWGQQKPFNLQCPKIGEDLCVTGCVATAMAQIVKYHGYPAVGIGQHSYEWNGEEVSFDYSATTFRYDAMLDSYLSASIFEQKTAVATLMKACGVAVDMDYGTDASSATDCFIAYALRNYFGYDNATRYLLREFFSDQEWEDLIYAELEQNRPVIYGGQAPHGGHQFICDGYDGNGLFHINWGWNFLGDGYYSLNSLEPEIQGTGGFEGGYNSNQAIVCGIQPAREGIPVWYPIYSTGALVTKEYDSSKINLSINSGGIFNFSQESVSVEFILKAVGKDGKEYFSEPSKFLIEEDGLPTTWLPFKGASGTSISGYSGLPMMNLPKDLPAGDYKCYVVIRTKEGNIQQVYFPRTVASFFNLIIDNSGNVSVTDGQPEARAKIKVTEFGADSEIKQNEKTTFHFTVENVGDVSYTGNIEYRIYKEGEPVSEPAYLTFNSMSPGSKATYDLTLTLSYEIGNYEIIFFDQYGDQISEAFKIAIGPAAVEAIFNDCQSADIYSLGGALIMKNADREYVLSLPKGLYILKSGNKIYKVIR